MNKIFYLCFILYYCVTIYIDSVQGLEKFGDLSCENKSTPGMSRHDIFLQAKSRTKRYITYNVLAPIDVGMLLAIPITLILPSMANLFNSRRFRRSPHTKKGMEQEIYEDDPEVQPHVDRVSNYFDLLQIPDKDCHQRAICELASSPEKYSPLSELVLQRLNNVPAHVMYQSENEEEESSSSSSSSNKSLFKLYHKAVDHGVLHGDHGCHQQFSEKCPHSIETRLNMPVVRFWNALKSLLKFTIKE